MTVTLDKSYPMPGSADAAWAVLADLERVAGCMPGAKITERTDDAHFKGTVAVRFGPANLTFRGEVEVLARDDAARSLQLKGKGTDTTGGSGAAMDLSARIEPVDEGHCTLTGRSEVSMSGKAAAFGSRLAVPVAEQVLQQFAGNFAAQVEAEQARRAAAAPAAAAAAPAGPEADEPPGAASADAGPLPAPVAPAAASLNGFALIWSILRSWLRGLFGGKA